MLTLVPQGGLCNRLRILLSAIQAKAQGVQPIRVEWGRDPECSAWFEELFVPVDMGGFRVVHRHWWAAPRTRRNLWLPVLLRLFMGYRVQRANYRPATDDDFFRLVRRGGGQGGGMDAAHRPEEGDHHARYAEGHPARARRA